jgi:hypothetical protein
LGKTGATNQRFYGGNGLEFEENDGKIERRSQATFSTHFYPMLLPKILLYPPSMMDLLRNDYIKG